MKLYYTPGACSQAVHIALREVGVPFSLEKVDIRSKKTESGADYLSINPKGYVPALALDDGQVLTEVQALLQYVGDRKPESGFTAPAGSQERYRQLEWLAFVSSELHKQFSPFFVPVTPDEWKAFLKQRIEGRFDLVNKHLESRPFLTGETFTAPDAYLFVVTSWSPALKLDLGTWPAIAAFAQRVASRPAVQAALEAEGFGKK